MFPVSSCRDWAGHVIVCGLDELGLRILEHLLRAGERAVIIGDETDPKARHVIAEWGIPCVPGSTDWTTALLEAGVSGAIAIICADHDDLRNLEAALIARELRADIRIVTQLTNRAVGRAVAADNGPGGVLDIAELAAPSMVEACLSSRTHELDIAGRRFVAAQLPVAREDTLRRLFGDLTPLAVIPGDGGEVALCPGRDHKVQPGDRAIMLGVPEEFDGHDVAVTAPEQTRRPGVRPWTRLSVLVSALVQEIDRGLRRALGILVTIIAISTLVLRYGYEDPGMTMLDGLYFTIETIATVGFGDFSFGEQPTWLRIYSIGLMMVGVGTVSILLAFFTDLLVSRRIERSAGRRVARRMSGHVVIVGLGSVGSAAMAGLVAMGRHVVVVDRDHDNRFLDQAQALEVPVIFGDGTQPQTLEAANLGQASSVAILTSDDMANIETGLAVKDLLGQQWPDVPVVLRVFDRHLGRMVARRFGFRHVRSTAELAAPWFVGAALGLDVLGTFSAEQKSLMVGSLTVRAGSGLDGLAMQDLSARTRVVAIKREATQTVEHPPRRDTRFDPGDQAYLIGPYEELLLVLRQGHAISATTDTDIKTEVETETEPQEAR